jgi:MFS superfamily sulfate permease-like transporter
MNLGMYWHDFAKRFDVREGKLKADLLVGITVSLVAIPQSLAYGPITVCMRR